MDNKFQGKRAELSVYDDAWICGDDRQEFIVPSPRLMHDRITAERHAETLDMVYEFLEKYPLGKIVKINGNGLDNTELMED